MAYDTVPPGMTIIKGGKKTKDEWDRTFRSAYVTDTRLMGAMGMYIGWDLADGEETGAFHQFFYVENEEAGLETYFSTYTEDPWELSFLEKENIGGLGGEKVPLTETEFKQILKYYADFNRDHGLPLPIHEEEFLPLIESAPPADLREMRRLLMLQCTDIYTVYEVLNYFMMRCFGQDLEAASLLTDPSLLIEKDGRLTIPPLYGECGISTMCRNSVQCLERDLTQDELTADGTYLCDALIEHDGRYEVVVAKITLEGLRITSYERTSVLPVSTAEAARILSRPEYVTVFEVLGDPESWGREPFTLEYDTMSEVEGGGRLFFSFHVNNSHVDRQEFRLSGDVRGVYFLTDYGQLIVMAYDIGIISQLEREIAASDMNSYLFLAERYAFLEPVLYEFVQSDFADFNEFVQALRTDP